MKRKMLWVLLASLILVGIMVAGCGKGGSPSSSPSAPIQGQGAVGEGGKWPSQMPPDVPKFTYGTITGNIVSSNTIDVMINKATSDSFDKYQSDLKNAGWTIGEASQNNGLYSIVATKGQRKVSTIFENSPNGFSGTLTYSANGT